VTYVDLRPCQVRRVEVLLDGVWWPGDLEAYRHDGVGWHGFVRHSNGPGLNHVGWHPQERPRTP
jgi:hypothetical protein